MREDLQYIYHAFGNKLVGSQHMKYHVCDVLSKMPEEVIDFVTKKCWFLSSLEDAWAFTFSGNDLKDRHMVFLSDHLLSQHVDQIKYTIAHEIGHVILEHKNSVMEKQTKSEIAKQEKAADEFAKKYLTNKSF